MQDVVVKVHVLPAQAEGLAGTGAGEQQEADDGGEPGELFGHVEEFFCLCFRQARTALFRVDGTAGKHDVVAGVGGYEPVVDRHSEHAAKDREDVFAVRGRDRQFREPPGQHEVIECGKGKCAKGREQEPVCHVAVVGPRGGLEVLLGIVCEVQLGEVCEWHVRGMSGVWGVAVLFGKKCQLFHNNLPSCSLWHGKQKTSINSKKSGVTAIATFG